MTEPGKPTTPIVLRIKLRYEDVDTLVARFAPNVGKAGVFLPTKSIHPVGTELKFEIRLSGGAAAAPPVIVGLGRVKSARDPDPANARAVFGIGVELMRVTKESREVILKILERRRSVGLADVAVPTADDVEAARRGGADEATGVRAVADLASGPVHAEVTPTPAPAPLPAPVAVVDRPSDALLTAPRRPSGPMAVQRVTVAAVVAPLAPEPSRRVRRTLDDLIASVAAAPASAPSGDMFGGDDEVDVQRVLARARTLAAGADLDAELEALKDSAAAPLAEISIEAASAELARQLGGVAVDRKNRGAKGTPPPGAPVAAPVDVPPIVDDVVKAPVDAVKAPVASAAAIVLAKLAGGDDAAPRAVADAIAPDVSAFAAEPAREPEPAGEPPPVDPPMPAPSLATFEDKPVTGSSRRPRRFSDASSVRSIASRARADEVAPPVEVAPAPAPTEVDEGRPTLEDPPALEASEPAPAAAGTYDDAAFARAQSEAPETLPETEEVGDDDVVEEIGEADVDEVLHEEPPPEPTVAVIADPRVYAAAIPAEDPEDDLPIHSQHTVAVDPDRALLIDDDVDPSVFDDRTLDPELQEHAELDLDAAHALQTSIGPAPSAIATAKPHHGYEHETVDADLQQHQLADRLDRALADAEESSDEDFSFDEGTRNAAAELEAPPDDADAEIDDFEILDEANLEEGDFVNRLELSNEFAAAPDDPLAGFRDSVASFGDERAPYRAPSDPLAGFPDDPSDPEGQPTWDPGTGSYTYAQAPREHREVAGRFDSEFEARSTGYSGARAFEDTALPENATRVRGYTVPPEPTTADPDLEHALEALDVDLDDLSGNRPPVDSPTRRPVTGAVRRTPRAPRANSEDDGIMIDFDDDE